MDGKINFYAELVAYVDLRKRCNLSNPRVFLRKNSKSHYGYPETFYKTEVIGKNRFDELIKEACVTENIVGWRDKDYPTTHSLRGTMDYVCTFN